VVDCLTLAQFRLVAVHCMGKGSALCVRSGRSGG